MTPTFEQFWNLYGLKRDKVAAERAWKRLSAKDRCAAVEGIKPYRQDCADHNRMMMYPQGYLNHRRWEDEMDSLTPGPSPVRDGGQESQRPTANGQRQANAEELQTLQAFREALLNKEPAKPYRWQEFQNLVAALTIPYVTEHNGVIRLAVLINGKPERITDFMIDYYDSYADFYHLLTLHFPEGKVTFTL